MIVFAGKNERGYFIQDVAAKRGMKAAFVRSSMDIKKQINGILKYGECKFIVYDIEQYINPSEEIAETVSRIKIANDAVPVIFAGGYNPKSDVIMQLRFHGIQNFIFSDNLSDKKAELEACMDGRINPDPKELELPGEEGKEELSRNGIIAKAIGIAGAVPRMGTTTQAVQFVKYLMFKGYHACYVQMNDHGWVEELAEAYEEVETDRELGRVTFRGVEMYYKLEKLQEVRKMGYDYYVYDYGVFNDRDFNKISFLEKDLQIFVVGTKPGEFMKTYELIENNFYNQVVYIFNFILDDRQEHEDIYELMQEKQDVTYFAPDCRDPFLYSNDPLYEEILPVEEIVQEEKVKKRWFRRGRKGHGAEKKESKIGRTDRNVPEDH